MRWIHSPEKCSPSRPMFCWKMVQPDRNGMSAQVCGVAVLCEGGGDIRVAARITELVSALLDLPSNRICVEQRKAETLQLL